MNVLIYLFPSCLQSFSSNSSPSPISVSRATLLASEEEEAEKGMRERQDVVWDKVWQTNSRRLWRQCREEKWKKTASARGLAGKAAWSLRLNEMRHSRVLRHCQWKTSAGSSLRRSSRFAPHLTCLVFRHICMPLAPSTSSAASPFRFATICLETSSWSFPMAATDLRADKVVVESKNVNASASVIYVRRLSHLYL